MKLDYHVHSLKKLTPSESGLRDVRNTRDFAYPDAQNAYSQACTDASNYNRWIDIHFNFFLTSIEILKITLFTP